MPQRTPQMQKAYDDSKKKLTKLFNAKDVKGTVDYLMEIYGKEIDANRGRNQDLQFSIPETEPVEGFLEEICAHTVTPDENGNVYGDFIKELRSELLRINIAETVKLKPIFEKNRERIKNGEVYNLELIVDEPKTVEKMAYNLTMIDPAYDKKKCIAEFLSILSGSLTEAANSAADAEFIHELKELSEPVEEGEIKKYSSVIPEEELRPLIENTIELSEKNRYPEGFTIRAFPANEHELIKILPYDIQKIKDSSDSGLAEYKSQLEKQLKNVEKYESGILEIRQNAEAFLLELEAAKKDNPSKEYDDLYRSLKTATSLGKSFDFKDEKGVKISTSDGFFYEGVLSLLNDISKNADAYAKEDPDFAKRTKKFAADDILKANNLYNNNIRSIAESTYKSFTLDKTSIGIKQILHRISLEQRLREKEKEYGRDDAYYVNRPLGIDDQKNNLTKFNRLAMETINSVMEEIIYFNTDKENRLAQGDTIKGTYKGLIDSINELKEFNTNLNNNPEALFNALQLLTDNANAYTQAHNGMFSGNIGEGRVRFDKSKALGDKLKEKMKQLKEQYELLPKLNKNETISDRISSLDKEKQTLFDNHLLKNEHASHIDETANTDSIIARRLNDIQKAHYGFLNSESNFADRKELAEICASQIIAVRLLGKRVKATIDSFGGDMTEEEIDSLHDDLLSVDSIKVNAQKIVEESEDFRYMMDKIKTPEQLDRFIEDSEVYGGNLLVDKLSSARRYVTGELSSGNNNNYYIKSQADQIRHEERLKNMYK